MRHRKLRESIIETVRSFNPLGLGVGSAGNASARVDGGLLITPSGIPYEEMRAGDIVLLDAAGAAAEGQLKPSSEWRFHRDIYHARPDCQGIVHVHSPYATAIACNRESIPAFHYMVAVGGGDSIRCAAYATYGTQALSDNALAALEGRRACLLANHGLIALGADLTGALRLALEVEELAKQYAIARQAGTPVLLPAEEMQRVLELFRDYGNPK